VWSNSLREAKCGRRSRILTGRGVSMRFPTNKSALRRLRKSMQIRQSALLVVSPDNRSRMEINERIHAELQSRGTVKQRRASHPNAAPRQNLTGADRTWAERYEVGDVLRYSRASKETGIGKGEYAQVKST